MVQLNFPDPTFKTRNSNNVPQIYDVIREKWVVLQPEEWVRQNFINWLVAVNDIPPAFISIEKAIMLGGLLKRYDLLIYNRIHKPWMMVECKAQGVSLDESVLRQVLRYNLVVPVRYIVITNGDQCYIADKQLPTANWLEIFPAFPEK